VKFSERNNFSPQQLQIRGCRRFFLAAGMFLVVDCSLVMERQRFGLTTFRGTHRDLGNWKRLLSRVLMVSAVLILKGLIRPVAPNQVVPTWLNMKKFNFTKKKQKPGTV